MLVVAFHVLVVTCAACCVINCAARRLRPSLTFNVTPVALAVPFLVWLSSTPCRAICRAGPSICLSSCCIRRPSHACRAVPLAIPRPFLVLCLCSRSTCRSYDEAIIISHPLYALTIARIYRPPADLLAADCVCRHVRVAASPGAG